MRYMVGVMAVPDSLPNLLLIDGHSVIFAWNDLREIHQENQTMAREQLVHCMNRYQDATGEQVVVVFDGKGADLTSQRENPDAVQVIYSAAGQTADDVIERITASHADAYAITAVTRDRAEAETVMAFGGHCMSPVSLKERLDRADAYLARQLAGLRRR